MCRLTKTASDKRVSLEDLVRYGLDQDNPQHLVSYLRDSVMRIQMLEPHRQAREYGRVLALLVDAIHDRSVPFEWRCRCLEFAFEPALLMKSVATSERQRQVAAAIEDELMALRHCVAPDCEGAPGNG